MGRIILKNILIVDDSLTARMFLKRMIKKSPFDVLQFYEAHNGEHGINILSNYEVDYIFLNLNMPGMDGLEMAKKIRQNNKLANIPIIFISSYETAENLATMEKLDIKGFLRKPIDYKNIYEILSKLSKNNKANYKIPRDLIKGEKLEEIFFNIIKKVFEKNYYLYPEQIDIEEIEQNYDLFSEVKFYCIETDIELIPKYDKSIRTKCVFYIPLNIAKMMIGNYLGFDELNEEEFFIEDNLIEFSNMIMGNFISENYREYRIKNSPVKIYAEKFNSTKLDNLSHWKVAELDNKYFFYQIKI